MLFEVSHATRYLYDGPVFLEPHLIRLKPFTATGQRLEQFSVEIQPAPAGTSEILDIEGNNATVCWFEGTSYELLIRTSASVAVSRSNPFEYLSFGETSLPYRYPQEVADAVRPYQASSADPEVQGLAQLIASRVGNEANAFLPALVAEIRSRCRLVIRPEGQPYPAGQTLALGEGSCRDLAVVFMDVCRNHGFAARFVSGYHAVLDADSQDLHAWGEVYLNGGGWRGFDPSTGLAVGNHHIGIATAAQPINASPVTGNFRGAARARLDTRVTIASPAVRLGMPGPVETQDPLENIGLRQGRKPLG